MKFSQVFSFIWAEKRHCVYVLKIIDFNKNCLNAICHVSYMILYFNDIRVPHIVFFIISHYIFSLKYKRIKIPL